nr:unnamed protein product [Callosobruchus chinensis]
MVQAAKAEQDRQREEEERERKKNNLYLEQKPRPGSSHRRVPRQSPSTLTRSCSTGDLRSQIRNAFLVIGPLRWHFFDLVVVDVVEEEAVQVVVIGRVAVQVVIVECHRKGPITRNAFLNYLRRFKKKHCNWHAFLVIGPLRWHFFDLVVVDVVEEEAVQVVVIGRVAVQVVIVECHRKGPITRNAFLNYLRRFKKKHCNWHVSKIAVEGAKCWCKMSSREILQIRPGLCITVYKSVDNCSLS